MRSSIFNKIFPTKAETAFNITWLLLLLVVIKPSESNNLDDEKTVIYKFTRHGLGSNLMNLIAHKTYYEEKGYIFKVDEHEIRYKYKGKGFLSSFFSPNFEVIENENILNQRLNDKPDAVVYDTNQSKRPEIKSNYVRKGPEAYNWLREETCKFLKFNPKASLEMKLYQKNHGIHEQLFESSSDVVSVGFHIRRGDKLKFESRKFHAVEYVDTLINLEIKDKIQNCFIASDDNAAILEMKEALKVRGVTCRVFSLAKSGQRGNTITSELSDDDMLQFMTEINILTKSTYFIGSFNSNLGAAVSLLRGCYQRDKTHYSQSYGVGKPQDRSDVFVWK